MFVLQNVTKYFPTPAQKTENLFPYISVHIFFCQCIKLGIQW